MLVSIAAGSTPAEVPGCGEQAVSAIAPRSAVKIRRPWAIGVPQQSDEQAIKTPRRDEQAKLIEPAQRQSSCPHKSPRRRPLHAASVALRRSGTGVRPIPPLLNATTSPALVVSNAVAVGPCPLKYAIEVEKRMNERTPTAEEQRNRALVEAAFARWGEGVGNPYELLAEDVSWTI